MDQNDKKMKKEISISSPDFPGIRLATIGISDIEELRIWKNACKESFFYQQIIEEKQQMEWYMKYSARMDDVIFVIFEKMEGKPEEKIGCIGFRFENLDTIDLYNVMRGKVTGGSAKIAEAMRILLSWIMEHYEAKIKCDVLTNNKAVTWYKKCGFTIEDEIDNYVCMSVNRETYIKCMIMEEKNYD